jgi:adenylate kinase
MITVIIGGKGRVGKTTVANIIAEFALENNLTPKIVPFAHGIKEAAKAKGLTKDSNPAEYRNFCQTLGESMRVKNPDHWVNEWKKRVKEIEKEETNDLLLNAEFWKERIIIVDDCRYVNEVAAARDLNAVSIFVKQGKRRIIDEDAEWRMHPSEELANHIEAGNKDYLEMFKYTVTNDSTLNALKNHCLANMNKWLGLTINFSENQDECGCELCTARREDRDPDPEKIINELMDILEKALEEEDEKNEGNS